MKAKIILGLIGLVVWFCLMVIYSDWRRQWRETKKSMFIFMRGV